MEKLHELAVTALDVAVDAGEPRVFQVEQAWRQAAVLFAAAVSQGVPPVDANEEVASALRARGWLASGLDVVDVLGALARRRSINPAETDDLQLFYGRVGNSCHSGMYGLIFVGMGGGGCFLSRILLICAGLVFQQDADQRPVPCLS